MKHVKHLHPVSGFYISLVRWFDLTFSGADEKDGGFGNQEVITHMQAESIHGDSIMQLSTLLHFLVPRIQGSHRWGTVRGTEKHPIAC